jgi:hypothetical protein
MHRQWTSEQIRTAILSAERELEHAIAATMAEDPLRKTILETLHPAVHAAVVSLVTVFRDQGTATTDVATLIAREYAKCVDGAQTTPGLACLRHVLSVVQLAREQRL